MIDTILIAFVTAFVTILLNHLFEVYRKEKAQRREVLISFYSKIKKAEAEIFELILRGNYGWGNVDEYNKRIGKAQYVYEKLLNEFYEQLLFNEAERIKTKKVIVSFWNNIITPIISSQTEAIQRNKAFNFYQNELQKDTEKLRKLYLKSSTTIFSKIFNR